MANIVRVTPVGVDIRSLGAPWQIAGITVSNPSGSWLTIPNVGNVPPYTTDWSIGLSPTVMAIDVLFTPSPSGTPSNLVGGPVTVTITDTEVLTSPGVPSGGEDSQQPGSVRSTFIVRTVVADSNVFTISPLISISPLFQIVPVLLTVSPNFGIASPPVPYMRLRGIVWILIMDPAGNEVFPNVAISPESPFAQVPALPIPFTINDLEIGTLSEPGLGICDVTVRMQYYVIRL